MPDNLGRDRVWTPQIWGEIDKAVQEEVGRIRVARKVFPTITLDGALNVPDEAPDLNTMTIPEGRTKPFIEIYRVFTLTQAQVDNEPSLRSGRTLARLTANWLALAEDILFFRGYGPFQDAKAQPGVVTRGDQAEAARTVAENAWAKVTVDQAAATESWDSFTMADTNATDAENNASANPTAQTLAAAREARALATAWDNYATEWDVIGTQNDNYFDWAEANRRLAVRLLASQGEDPPLAFLAQMGVTNVGGADRGLLDLAKEHNEIKVHPVERPKGAQGPRYSENTLQRVIEGITTLNGIGQPGPYALILESGVYADSYSPLKDTLMTPADRITPLLSGGFHVTGALRKNTGLLVSLGAEPTVLYTSKSTSQDVTTAFTGQDEKGNYRFRVSERVQIVVRDPRALVLLTFR